VAAVADIPCWVDRAVARSHPLRERLLPAALLLSAPLGTMPPHRCSAGGCAYVLYGYERGVTLVLPPAPSRARASLSCKQERGGRPRPSAR